MSTRMICETCGASLNMAADGLSGSCPYCRNTYYFKEEKGEALIFALNRARGHRLACDFYEAIKEYRLVLERFPNDAEANFGMFLSTYGIEFVEDRRTGRFIPTCHRFVDRNPLTNDSYLKATENATEAQRRIYTATAEKISRLQSGIKAKLDSEEPYDVFISFKSTDAEGKPTEDSVIARNIYDALTKKGIKVFFSEVTLADRIGDEFEPIIYRALYSCRFFILVATKIEHVNSAWVKNEWSRFEDRIAEEGLSGAAAAVFRGINPYDLPRVFATQGVDVEKHPFDYAITVADSIEKKLRSQPSAAEVDELRRQLEELKRQIPKAAVPEEPKQKSPTVSVQPAPVLPKAPEVKPQAPTVEHSEFYRICEVYDGVLVKCKDKNVEEIDIPYGIRAIGNRAFKCFAKLRSVTIPSSVTSIGDEAFEKCAMLESVVIPDSVTHIGMYAFTYCQALKSVRLSESLTEIGDCFGECKALLSIKIPNKVREISWGAFMSCESLADVTLSNNLKKIGRHAFSKCRSLKVLYVPDSVKHIEENAFWSCKNLQSLSLPFGIETVEKYAFGDCMALRSVRLPASLKPRLWEIFFRTADLKCDFMLLDPSFFDMQEDKLVRCRLRDVSEISLPEGVTAISEYAFSLSGATLRQILIPDSVQSIDDNAFAGCLTLKNVTIPKRFKPQIKNIFPKEIFKLVGGVKINYI